MAPEFQVWPARQRVQAELGERGTSQQPDLVIKGLRDGGDDVHGGELVVATNGLELQAIYRELCEQ